MSLLKASEKLLQQKEKKKREDATAKTPVKVTGRHGHLRNKVAEGGRNGYSVRKLVKRDLRVNSMLQAKEKTLEKIRGRGKED